MRSRRPHRMPVDWGPRIALPPEKATRSAPAAMIDFKFERGGTSPAASTSTGRLRAWARLTSSASGGCALTSYTYNTPAVFGPNVASNSHASARRTPAPATIS